MMQELVIRFDNIIHHAVSLWLVLVILTIMCASATWAIRIWSGWYKACFSAKKKKDKLLM
jgi:Trk-type K+ transport system membrane component